MLELCPEGFEEVETAGEVELVAYVDGRGEERLRRALPDARASDVALGWEDAWRAFHRPVAIGPLWVGPPWETPRPGAVAVVIDPGQAFGTGAHPTTRLCLELLLAEPPGAAADLGCGSGVLAIAAARLGFAPVVAVDADPAAVDAARANARANGVRLDVRRADVLCDPLPAAPLVLANLEPGLVEALAPRLDARTLIASGYLAADDPAPAGWRRAARRELDGWAADRFLRP
jgi:ribosomal protein L11 methyltransferase